MAEDVAVQDLPTNFCCTEWKKRYTKFEKKLVKSENSRKALRDAIGTLEKQLKIMHTDNLNLKKACEEEKALVEHDREEKAKEAAVRISLENDISSFQKETLLLQEKAQGLEEELRPLQAYASEGKAEIKRLNELLEREKQRAEFEKKKSEEALATLKAERGKADVERKKNNDIIDKVDEENGLKLNSVKSQGEAEIERLKELLEKEKEQADLEKKKADEASETLKVERSRLDGEMKKIIDTKDKANEENRLKLEFLNSHAKAEIERLKELLEKEKERADLEKKKANEALETLKAERSRLDGEMKKNTDIKNKANEENRFKLESLNSHAKAEIERLKGLLEKEKERADLEKKKADEALETLQAERRKADEERNKVSYIKDIESEENRLKLKSLKSQGKAEIERLEELLQKEKERADFEKKKANEALESLKAERSKTEEKRKNSDIKDKEIEEYRLKLEYLNSEGIAEIERLKELLDNEKGRADFEKKKAEAEKEKANEALETLKMERRKADEERRKNGDIQANVNEGNRLKLESLSREAEVLRSTLVLEELKLQEANKKLEGQRQNVIKEKERANLEKTKAEEQHKLTEFSRKMAMDEKCRADNLSRLLEEERQTIQKLKKEIAELVSSRKTVDILPGISGTLVDAKSGDFRGEFKSKLLKGKTDKSKLVLDCLTCEMADKKFDTEKQMKIIEKGLADMEMRKAEEQKKIADKYKEATRKGKRRVDQLGKKFEAEMHKRIKETKRADSEMRRADELVKFVEKCKQEAMEEKLRADHFEQDLKENRQKISKLQNQIEELVSSRKLVDSGKNMIADSAQIKLLKKQMKLGKMQLKHAKEVVKWERNCNNNLQKEVCLIKQEFFQFAQRLEVMSNCFTYREEGLNDIAMTGDEIEKHPMNLRTNHFGVVPPKMQALNTNEPVKPTDTLTMDGLLPFDLSTQCARQSLTISEGNGNKSISGIDSKFGRMRRGCKRKLLQSSAKNSCAASFSDRQLLGSQERGSSAKVMEERSSSKPGVLGLLAEITSMRCTENVAGVAEDNAMSPTRRGVVEKRFEYSKKRKIMPSLHGMVSSQKNKSSGTPRHFVSGLEGKSHKTRERSSLREVNVQHSIGFDGRENILGNEVIGKRDIYTLLHSINDVGTVKGSNNKIVDSVRSDENNCGSFDDVLGSDYMKLLDLDDDGEEEHYRVAVATPLSPTLPEIEFQMTELQEINDVDAFAEMPSYHRPSNENIALVQFGCRDVVNVEIDSNMLNFNASRSSCCLPLNENKCLTELNHKLSSHSSDSSGSAHDLKTDSGFVMSNISIHQINKPQFSFEGPSGFSSCNLPEYCVISSDIPDVDSIDRVFKTLETCMAECSAIHQLGHVVRNALASLMKLGDLSPKEKISVLFSLLLHKVSGTVSENILNSFAADCTMFLDSFAREMHSVLSDAATCRMLRKVFDLGELLFLIEDFLIARIIWVHGDASFSFQAATTHQLMVGAVLLASVCAAVNHIGFICEASYTIIKTLKVNSSLMLSILHVFAHLCGSKYFTNTEYRLLMTVVKSIVRSIEKVDLLTDRTACYPSVPSPARCQFSSFIECPFHNSAPSLDIVVSLLLEKVQNYALSFNPSNLNELASSLNSGDLFDGCSRVNNSGQEGYYCDVNMNSIESSNLNKIEIQTNTVFDEASCRLNDILSLVELVACNKNWKWTLDNIVSRLLKILESCVLEKYLVAIVLLLGQLGRMGVASNGHEDAGVKSLRSNLVAFLRRSKTRNLGFQIKIATASALIELLPIKMEEFTGKDLRLTADIRRYISEQEWSSSLSEDQQSMLLRLLQTSCI